MGALPGLGASSPSGPTGFILSIPKKDAGLVVQPYFDSIAEVVSQRVINLATKLQNPVTFLR